MNQPKYTCISQFFTHTEIDTELQDFNMEAEDFSSYTLWKIDGSFDKGVYL